MKKFIVRMILTASLMSLSLAASAQVYVGGGLAGGYSSSKNANSTSWNFSVRAEAGYMLHDNWAFGARFSYGKSESRVAEPLFESIDTDVDAFAIRPYAAYCPFRRGDFALWAEFGLVFVPEQGTLHYTTYGAYVGPVLTYNLNEHLILKTNLDFACLSVSGNTRGDFNLNGALGGNSDLSIGFVYKF